MRKTRVCLTLGCLLFTLASCTWAQGGRKPGLWEVTSTMTFQQSPFPAGMQAPGGSPFSGAPKTTQVCVTQAMIDKYGGPPPQTRGDCQMSNVATTLTGMTGTLTCTLPARRNFSVSGNEAPASSGCANPTSIRW